MKTRAVRILRSLLRIYLLLLVAVFFGQRWMLYHPFKASEPKMIEDAQSLSLSPWKNSEGTIIGWRSNDSGRAKAANRLLVFHGNAANALYREPYVEGFESLDHGRQWEVTLFEYPGYGARPGSPNRAAFTEAARAAITQLTEADDRPLYVLGESIGSGVACEIAAEQPERIRGVILVTPFARLAEVAQKTMPFLPAGMMLRDRWDNITALGSVRSPVAVLIAGCDEVVGCDQGEQLFASLREPAKQRWFFPIAGHNSMDLSPGANWWREVSDFVLGARK